MGILNFLGLGPKPGKPAPPAANADSTVRQISVQTAHQRSTDGEVVLIDVRMPEEWHDTGRPLNSHGITLQDPEFENKLIALVSNDKSRALAFSCKTGGRSSQAAQKAVDAGHTDVSNVEGGFLAWQAADLPIEQGPF